MPLLAVSALFVLPASLTAREAGYVPRHEFPIANGVVRTMAIDPVAGVLYLGGDFTQLNPIHKEVTVPVSQEIAVDSAGQVGKTKKTRVTRK
jgi:hypothetical protein